MTKLRCYQLIKLEWKCQSRWDGDGSGGRTEARQVELMEGLELRFYAGNYEKTTQGFMNKVMNTSCDILKSSTWQGTGGEN